MKNERFQSKLFTLLAAEANHTDKELAKDNYYALIRVIIKRLIKDEKITLPNFGTFFAQERKSGRGRSVHTGELFTFAPTVSIRFRPCIKLKYYFKNITIRKRK